MENQIRNQNLEGGCWVMGIDKNWKFYPTVEKKSNPIPASELKFDDGDTPESGKNIPSRVSAEVLMS